MGAAKDRFLEFVAKNVAPKRKYLPLVHITTAFRFAEIIPGDRLVPVRCKVMKDDVVYLFYGRPAYKPKDAVTSELEFTWPIVLIVDPYSVERIKRIYPFDTGAFVKRLYNGFFHSSTNVRDFEMDGDLSFAESIVNAFYTSQESYLTGFANRNVDVGPMEFEAQGLHSLHRFPSWREGADGAIRDERSSTVEVQVGEEINLPDNLLGVVIPQPYLDLEVVVKALDRWRIKNIEFYEPTGFGDQNRISGQIYSKVLSIYRKEGYVK